MPIGGRYKNTKYGHNASGDVRPVIDPAGADDDAGVVGDLLANLAHLYGMERFRRMADNAVGHADAEGGRP